jgi:hypothetical protein
MATRKRLKLEHEWTPEQITKAFRGIGEEAIDFLEHEIIYGEGGRRELAREILGYATARKESKITRNVEDS